MVKTVRVRIDQSLANVLENTRREIALGIKKKYKLKKVTVHGTMASELLARKFKNSKSMNFKIDKTSVNKGILKFV